MGDDCIALAPPVSCFGPYWLAYMTMEAAGFFGRRVPQTRVLCAGLEGWNHDSREHCIKDVKIELRQARSYF